jgi:hypothetical protein
MCLASVSSAHLVATSTSTCAQKPAKTKTQFRYPMSTDIMLTSSFNDRRFNHTTTRIGVGSGRVERRIRAQPPGSGAPMSRYRVSPTRRERQPGVGGRWRSSPRDESAAQTRALQI